MATGSLWDLRSKDRSPMRKSLVARARKRTTVRVAPDEWVIYGNPSLSDTRDSYTVTRVDGEWDCTCHGHDHGDTRARTGCSHITGAMLWLEENPDAVDVDGYSDLGAGSTDTGTSTGDDPERHEPAPLNLQPVLEGWDPSHLDPDHPPLPSQVLGPKDVELQGFDTYRPAQWQAIVEAVELFRTNTKVVFLSAPTGAGKTLISESVRRILGVRGIYTCTTKVLQDQVMRDFGYFAKLLKGRSNYPTLDQPTNQDLTAGDCTREKAALPACASCTGFSAWDRASGPTVYHCDWCHPAHQCPYEKAKWDAVRAQLAVLNTAYLLAETNRARGLFSKWPFVIIDEADKLEEELMRYVEVGVTPRMRKRLQIGLPAKKTVEEEWVAWARNAVRATDRWLQNRTPQLIPDVKARREERAVVRLREELLYVLEEEEDDQGDSFDRLSEGWVYTGYENKKEDWATVTFKPVMVRDYARDALWNHGDRFLLMSATFVSAQQMAYDLGLDDDEWEVVEVPSSFPPERRPIIPQTVAPVTAKTKDKAYPLIAESLRQIIDQHRGERILVHTVSYELTNYLYEQVRQPRVFRYTSAKDRNEALENYLGRKDGVLLAPSFDRGVDLHQDDCRVIVIAKVPFPYLGDKQVNKRAYGTGRQGKIWYAVQTIRTIIQMTGRGMRSADDWATTYILDEKFLDLYRQNRRLFPKWWSDAIVWDVNDPKWRDVLKSRTL